MDSSGEHGLAVMSNPAQQIFSKAWKVAHVSRDDRLSYMAYMEQITFLLFLKTADVMTKPPLNRLIGCSGGVRLASSADMPR